MAPVPAPAVRRPIHRRGGRIVAGVLAGLLVLGCSSDGDADPDGPAPSDDPDQAGAEVDLSAKPDPTTILDPDRGEPPVELVIEDLVVGDGDEAVPGSPVSVHYVGVDWATGEQFDASWDRGQPFVFGLGAGQVIAGWDQGVAGMQVGGRRVLTIPPDLAYGDRAVGDVIAPNATLVFVVDLLEVG